MKINWRVRAKNPQFWIGLAGVIASPVLAYLGVGYEDLTTWQSVGDVLGRFVENPYLIGTVCMAVLSFLGVLTDPTTKGIRDSPRAMGYDAPGDGEEE